MTGDNKQIAKNIMEACTKKDFVTVRKLVNADYKLKDPMMSLEGVEELVKMMESCPSDGKIEDAQYIADGDRVVATFTCVNLSPEPWKMRMCSIMSFKGGKLASEETFYDTAQIPAQLRENMKKDV